MLNEAYQIDEYDGEFGDYDEYDEFDERAKRRKPAVRMPQRGPKVAPYTTPSRTGGPGQAQFALKSEVDAAFAKVRVDVEENKKSLASVTAQTNSAVQRLGDVSSRLDREVKKLREEAKGAATSNLLLFMLTSQSTQIANPTPVTIKTDKGDVTVLSGEVKPSNNMLPLVLLASGGFGGSGSGGMDQNMMLPLVLLMSQK